MSIIDLESNGNTFRLTGPLARRHRARVVGAGRRVVVFAHGFGTDQGVWNQVVAGLPPGYVALLFDLPGAGPLLPPNFDPDLYRSLSAFADDLLALLDEIGIERCVYVGHSVSGMIGVMAAIEEPQRFERLALINASPRYLNDRDYEGGLEPDQMEGIFAAMAGNYQAWVAGFAPATIGRDLPGAISEFSNGLLAMRPDIALRIVRSIFLSDVRELLPALRVPTTLIHSTADMAVPVAVGRYLHDRIVGSQLVWIEEEGHLPHLSNPAEVSRALRGLLAA